MSTWLYVRATINMRGLSRDQEAWIDVELEQFAPLLEARYLISVDPPYGETGPDEDGASVD